jgi:hypothetical protein
MGDGWRGAVAVVVMGGLVETSTVHASLRVMTGEGGGAGSPLSLQSCILIRREHRHGDDALALAVVKDGAHYLVGLYIEEAEAALRLCMGRGRAGVVSAVSGRVRADTIRGESVRVCCMCGPDQTRTATNAVRE